MDPRDFLRGFLAKKNLSAYAAAREAGNPSLQSTMSRFMSNPDYEPRLDTLKPVAERFGFDPRAFHDPEVAEAEAARLKIFTAGTPSSNALAESGDKAEKVTSFSASLRPQKRSFLTHYPKSPPIVDDWAAFGSSSVFDSDKEEPFEALTVPGTFPNGYRLTRVPGVWMEPEIKEGDWIWVAQATQDDGDQANRGPHTVEPKDGDTVIAESTDTGARFMGVYGRGYRSSEFYITPNRGKEADSTKHPVRVLAVVMMQLKLLRGMRPDA